MVKRVAVVHTTPITIEILKPHFERHLPGVSLVNIVDDSLLNDTRAAGQVTRAVLKRIYSYFLAAENMGIDVIFNACSSVGETVDYARQIIKVPIVKIDEPTAAKAISMGEKIAVVGTLKTTLEPTTRLVKKTAHKAGVEPDVHQELCDAAYDLLMAGKKNEHDNLLKEKIRGLVEVYDAVILAQASMSRIELKLPDELKTKVLTTPERGVLKVKEVLSAQG